MMTRSKTRACSNTRNQEEKPETIPFDLVIEILLRSPVKSIARFRSVSKLWESTLATPNFTKSFFTISSSRPKLLFTCLKDNETFFFSSPSPCSQDRPPIDAGFHMSFSINCVSNICRPVRGLVCGLNQRTSKGGTVTMPLVCNPSTGQFLALPMVKTRRKGVISFFGYDPVDKHFKILCMTQSYIGPYTSEDHQVLTVEIGKKRLSWRKIECDLPHYPASVEHYDGICINGVIYYLAYFSVMSFPDIACFDIRSEKFSCIKRADHGMDMNSGARFECALVNYKGKLAKLQPNTYDHVTYTGQYGVQLWVLEDAEKHQWSSHIYVMPPPWDYILAENKLRFVGTTLSGEIVLSPDTICDFFYLAYYKPEKNTISIVGIKGMEAVKGHRAYTFLDHEEDVKLLSSGSDHGFVT